MKKRVVVLFLVMMLLLTGCVGKEKQENPPEQLQPPATVEGENNNEEKSIYDLEPQLPGAVMVMVDNYYKARPQSGLDKADVVYEIVAECGITRFMGIFYQHKVEKIGPIRSARDYFVKLARGYDAPLAHAGGSQAALDLIREVGMKDLDEIYNSGHYFWRDGKRKMPHNLYSSTDKLLEGAKKRGYKLEQPFLQPVGVDWQGESFDGGISLDYSIGKYKYQVGWNYNNNSYERTINEEPHLMADDTLIIADNVIVMATKISTYVKDEIPYSNVGIVGKGDVLYYINGMKIKGYWQKKTVASPIKFYDENGDLMKLKKGRTWIQVIPNLENINENDKVS